MKTFSQFNEDAAGATQAAISRSGSFEGGSSASTSATTKSQPTIDWIAMRKRNKDEKEAKQKQVKQTPDGPGKQKDRKPQKYRQAIKTASPKPEKGGALAKRSAQDSGSMVQKKTAASKQPPQHKQISARPVSSAIQGGKKKPATKAAPIRPQINPQAARKSLPAARG